MATSLKRSQACIAAVTTPNLAARHHQPTPLLETSGHSRASLGSLLWSHCSFLLGPGAHNVLCVLQESVSPVLCKFWWLYGRINGDLLQEGLCHTQICCTQSPCPRSRPLLTFTFAGDTQTQFWLSLCGVSGSWCVQDLFEPYEHLWQVRGLILNVILPLLSSCWGFSFALGYGVSFLLGSDSLQSTVVQQQVIVLEFLQEKMSAHPSILPSYATSLSDSFTWAAIPSLELEQAWSHCWTGVWSRQRGMVPFTEHFLKVYCLLCSGWDRSPETSMNMVR